jgi:glycosyltransferase involved in cell wall biosynthesis
MRVVYVSYDGALDPLGASQIMPYLRGLSARGVHFSLVSFEKPARWADVAAREAARSALTEAGIAWHPLVYHKRPRIPATLWDLRRGAQTVARAVTETRAQIVHCRGDLAMTMARWSGIGRSARLLYDVRGFFADERVESGSWRGGSLVDRFVRRLERANRASAAGLVVLTEKGREVLARAAPLPPHRVIPTCVDTERFRPRAASEIPDFGLVYSGSLGTWYMASEMVSFARETAALLPRPPLFLTPDVAEARRHGVDTSWAALQSVEPADVPSWLRRATAAFFFIRPTPAKRASSPTKLGEALASGLPVVANRGIGDVDDLVEESGVAALLRGFDSASYREAMARLRVLLAEPSIAMRCRHVAETRLSTSVGVDLYYRLYEEILGVRASSLLQ